MNRAIRDYYEALDLDPMLVPAYNNRGLSYYWASTTGPSKTTMRPPASIPGIIFELHRKIRGGIDLW